jgi:hypothetical protein
VKILQLYLKKPEPSLPQYIFKPNAQLLVKVSAMKGEGVESMGCKIQKLGKAFCDKRLKNCLFIVCTAPNVFFMKISL